MKKADNSTKHLRFVCGFLLGAMLFGCSSVIAAGITAQPKTAAVIIDGKVADLEGYVIDGAHYFQLRDLNTALASGGKDFSLVWDDINNQIVIDTSRSYDPNETIQSVRRNALLAEYTQEIVHLTNIERANAGLAALTVAEDLSKIALIKAQDMADNQYLSHDSPVFGKTKDLMDRNVWRRYMGENCARGSRTPEDVVKGWMNSEGHRDNILNGETTHIGVGVVIDEYGIYLWTQFFAIAK